MTASLMNGKQTDSSCARIEIDHIIDNLPKILNASLVYPEVLMACINVAHNFETVYLGDLRDKFSLLEDIEREITSCDQRS